MMESLFLSPTFYWLSPLAIFFVCYLFLKRKKGGLLILLLGIIAFVFISFVVLRDTHPRRSVDFGPMARFLGMYYGQLFLMLIFSFVWWVVADNKDKRPFDFTDSTKIPFKNSKDNEE